MVWDGVERAFLFRTQRSISEIVSERSCGDKRHESLNSLRVSMGAFDIGPAAPATRPQRAV